MAEISVSPFSWSATIRWREIALGAAGVAAAVVAGLAATQVTAPVESDYGLVAVLPGTFWLALGVLNVLMVLELGLGRISWKLMALLQLCLCAIVYGTPGFATGTPRTEVAWRHLGITDTLVSTGQIDPQIDAYFGWPGFFAGLGGVLETSGLDPQFVALVAPVVNGLLWAVGVGVVVRALTRDERHVWLALWLFTLTNWIGQDYLSPQAFAFFLYLVVVALLLTALAAKPAVGLRQAIRADGLLLGPRVWWNGRTPVEQNPRLRVAALVLCVLICVALIASHQLTPFVLLAAVSVLTLSGRNWAPGLAIVIGIILVLWLTTAASDYLSGHPVLFATDAAGVAGENVTDRNNGSPGHVDVVHVRTAMTAVCYALAALGFRRLWRRGSRDIRPALLLAVPFAMVLVNSYGGEVLMRATLFAAPFTAYYVAALLLPSRATPPVTKHGVAHVAMIGLLLVLSVGMVTARFGNARFDMFTEQEIRAAAKMYELAPPGALLIAGAHPNPWRYRDYADFRHDTLLRMCPPPTGMDECYGIVRAKAEQSDGGALVLLSRANLASLRMQGEISRADFVAFERLLALSGDDRIVYQNLDVRIYQFPPLDER